MFTQAENDQLAQQGATGGVMAGAPGFWSGVKSWVAPFVGGASLAPIVAGAQVVSPVVKESAEFGAGLLGGVALGAGASPAYNAEIVRSGVESGGRSLVKAIARLFPWWVWVLLLVAVFGYFGGFKWLARIGAGQKLKTAFA